MLRNLEKISPLDNEVIRFLKEIAHDEKIEKIIVFGSRAYGDYDCYSDIDLAVVAPKYEKSDWVMLYAQAIHDIRTVLRISIVNFVSNPAHLQRRILRSGVVIYD